MKFVGETTIIGTNQVSLPAQGVRELGWERGDHLLVEIIEQDMLMLIRKPKGAKERVETFSGKLGDVFGDHEDNLRYLDEERRSWGPE